MSAGREPARRGKGGRVVLWDAARPRLVERGAAEALWRAGKVSGLFNLQTQEQFDACQDLCVEAADGSRAAAQSEAEEVQSLRTRLADTQAENLVLEEQLRAATKRGQQARRDEHGELVRTRRECAALQESNAALRRQVRSAEKTVAQQKAEIGFVFSSLVWFGLMKSVIGVLEWVVFRALKKDKRGKKEKRRKDAEGDAPGGKQREQQKQNSEECAALRAQLEEANALVEDLRGDLKSERETVRFVVVTIMHSRPISSINQ